MGYWFNRSKKDYLKVASKNEPEDKLGAIEFRRLDKAFLYSMYELTIDALIFGTGLMALYQGMLEDDPAHLWVGYVACKAGKRFYNYCIGKRPIRDYLSKKKTLSESEEIGQTTSAYNAMAVSAPLAGVTIEAAQKIDLIVGSPKFSDFCCTTAGVALGIVTSFDGRDDQDELAYQEIKQQIAAEA